MECETLNTFKVSPPN